MNARSPGTMPRAAAWTLGARVSTLVLLLAAPVTSAGSPSPAPAPAPPLSNPALPSSAGSDDLAWLDQLGAYFEQHPDLKTQRGSGWNPYNRIRWALSRRLTDGRLPAHGARWEAWLVHRERAASAPARASWFELGPVHLSGRALDIEFHPADPSRVYIGSATGGLWMSTDGGDTWITTTEELPTLGIGAVLVLPWNPDVVLLGTGEPTMNYGRAGGVGVLKSTDAGLTWSPTGLSYPAAGLWGHGFHVMEANPLTGTILAGARDGLWRSTDEGETWTAVKVGGDYYDVKWKPGDPARVYCVKGAADAGNNVKVSTDDGLTWTKAGTGQPPGIWIGKSKLAVTPADPGVVYVYYTSSQTSATLGVYRSTDDGATWTARNTDAQLAGGQGWYNLVLAVDPDDADLVLGGMVYLMRSTDGGSTFAETGAGYILGDETRLHVDHHGIAYEPGSPTNVWVANDGGVWRSTDDGATWRSRREGINTYQFYDICVAQSDPIFMMGGTQDNGVPGRTGPTDWFETTLVADGMVCNVDPTDASIVYAEEQVGVHVRSTDGGQSWTEIMNGITGLGAWVTPVDEDQNAPAHLYTYAVSGIYRTTNAGNLWENVASHQAVWISISPVDGDVVWTLGDASGVQVTTDDGVSWTAAAPFGFAVGPATRILADPADVQTAFACFGGYEEGTARVARTTDQGSTWTDVTGDFPAQPVNVIVVDPADPDHWYVGTDVGVWASTTGGATWIPFEAGLPNAVVYDLEIQRTTRKLVAGTHGRGAWETNLPPPNSTGAPVVAAGPRNLLLDPPHPNPVRGQTWLRYAARHEGAVTLTVYDVTGRLVGRVAEHGAGDGVIRTVPWLTDDVGAGVYFAVLKAGAAVATRKITVLE